jgi:hypothetical protein
MKISEQEQQMIELLREWESGDDFRLEIIHDSGAWEIKLSGKGKWTRGVGKTFDEAWDNDSPSWA